MRALSVGLMLWTFTCALVPTVALAENLTRRSFTLAAEPNFGFVHTVDGSFGPNLLLEFGIPVGPDTRLSCTPVLRLGAAYLALEKSDDAIPLTASLGLALRYDFKSFYVALQGFGGIGDGGGTASHDLQPLAGGGFMLEMDVAASWRLGLLVSTSALLGDKSIVWTTVGPRIAWMF